ncbi:protein of unknown function [Georgfuchsia toluolica]|uniref:Uncharacterized protein n=1 Tax=Georgfuchsia toluolica TaxID=424218 RepID=A0A916J521_9PROT|nr:protein of unknown function [Georgfuchsia toluolica]
MVSRHYNNINMVLLFNLFTKSKHSSLRYIRLSGTEEEEKEKEPRHYVPGFQNRPVAGRRRRQQFLYLTAFLMLNRQKWRLNYYTNKV